MNQTFMKEKPIIPLVISMSLPMAVSNLRIDVGYYNLK